MPDSAAGGGPCASVDPSRVRGLPGLDRGQLLQDIADLVGASEEHQRGEGADVEFDGPLSDEQRERLLAIANRCPVHLTLTSRIDIRTTLRAATQKQVPGSDPAS